MSPRTLRLIPWLTAGCLALLAALVLGALGPAAAQTNPPRASFDVTPVKDVYTVGDIITVTVRLENLTNFFGGQVTWSFDPGAFQVVDQNPMLPQVQVQPGDLFPSGSFFSSSDLGHANNSTGWYKFGGARPTGAAFSGSGSLVITTFRVVGICGLTRLALGQAELLLLDPNANRLDVEAPAPLELRTPYAPCNSRLFLPMLNNRR